MTSGDVRIVCKTIIFHAVVYRRWEVLWGVVLCWLVEIGVNQMKTLEVRKETDHSDFSVGTASY